MIDPTLLWWAFGAGILASAPVGPVNLVAIRRGLIVGPAHALFVAAGSVLVESLYVALAFFGGVNLIAGLGEDLHRYRGQVGLIAGIAVVMIGLLILYRALAHPRRLMAAVRLERRRTRPANMAGDAATGALLTVINPATALYWLLAAGPIWLHKAGFPQGSGSVWWGFAAAVAGMCAWFVFLACLVRLRPKRVGPTFFRWVNILCGGALAVVGIVVVVKAIVGG